MENNKSKSKIIFGGILITPLLSIIAIYILTYISAKLFNLSGELALFLIVPTLISVPLFLIGVWLGKFKKIFIAVIILWIALVIWSSIRRSIVVSNPPVPTINAPKI